MSAPTNCCTPCNDTELIEIPGIQGIPGVDGTDGVDGINAYTTLSAAATIPAVNANVSVTVVNNSWAAIGQTIFISDGADWGTFTVVSKTGTTAMVLTFLGTQNDSAAGAIIGAGGQVSPAGLPIAPQAPAAGSPEGVVTAVPGSTYLNTTDDSFWIKKTGTGNTGWLQLIACLLLMASLAAFAAPPVVRNQITTNSQPAALGVVTNIFTNIVLSVGTNFNVKQPASENLTNWSALAVTAVQPATANLTNWSARPQGLSGVFHVVDALTALTNQFWFTNGVLYVTNRYVF